MRQANRPRTRRAADLAISKRLRAATRRVDLTISKRFRAAMRRDDPELAGQRWATMVVDGEEQEVLVGPGAMLRRSHLERRDRELARREAHAFIERLRAQAPTASRDFVLSTIRDAWPVAKHRPRRLDDDEVRHLFDACKARGYSNREAWKRCADRTGGTEQAVRASLKRSAHPT